MNDEPRWSTASTRSRSRTGVGYDDLYLAGLDRAGFVVCVEIPDYEAIYHCALG
jgi:hypothetical protein